MTGKAKKRASRVRSTVTAADVEQARGAEIEIAQQIQSWPIERLKPYDRNPRTHSDGQVTKLAGMIAEFGFTDPILVDGKGGVIAGHLRLAAARSLDLKHVPVIELSHLSPAQRQAFVMAHNRIALDSGWDDELLRGELLELQEAEFDLELSGFSEAEIEELLEEPEPVKKETKTDATPCYMLVFDSQRQRRVWTSFLSRLRGRASEKASIGKLVVAFVTANDEVRARRGAPRGQAKGTSPASS